MEKKIFFTIILIITFLNSFSQSYKIIDWDDKTVNLKSSDDDLQGIFSNHYIEYYKSKFSEDVYVYETHHMKTKINKITDESNNEILISKINVSEIIDVKSKVINNDSIKTYGFNQMKEMINTSTSTENYNYYKIPGINEQDIVEIIYTVKKDFNFNGNKIIEESYPILSSKFILIENDFKSNIKIYNSYSSSVIDTLFDGKKSKLINFKNLDATSDEQYSTPIANKIKVAYQCYENRDDISQTEYWNNLVQNVRELFFPISINPIADELFNELKSKKISIPFNEISVANAIDEYIKDNFTISDDENSKLKIRNINKRKNLFEIWYFKSYIFNLFNITSLFSNNKSRSRSINRYETFFC